jgi:hypothetical protein
MKFHATVYYTKTTYEKHDFEVEVDGVDSIEDDSVYEVIQERAEQIIENMHLQNNVEALEIDDLSYYEEGAEPIE